MSRKYTLNGRPSSTCICSFYGQTDTTNGHKQNGKEDISKIDHKLNEIKKKYQQPKSEIKFQEKDQNKYFHRQTGNLRQQEVLRKLENFKSELQSIPNWENFARNVLFNEYESSAKQKKLEHYKNSFGNNNERVSKNNEIVKENIFKKQESHDESKLLLGSNISFKIKQTSTIQRYGTPIQNRQDFRKHHTPNKSINQFEIEKIKQNSKQKRFQPNNNNVDKQINEIQRKIRQADLKKKMLGVQFIPFDRKIQHLRQDSSKKNLEKEFKSRTPEIKFRNLQTKNMQSTYSRPPTQPKRNSKVDEFIKTKFKLNETYDATSPRFAQVNQSNHTEENVTQKTKSFIQTIRQNQFQGYAATKQRYGQQKNFNEQSLKYPKSMILKNKQGQKEKSYWNQTQQSMKERKRRLQSGGGDRKKSKQTITKLVNVLCQQVKLDQKFRNSKLWFKSFKNEKKLQRLKSLLNIQGFHLSITEIQQQFEVTEKQDNPFFSVTSQNCDIEDVARCYAQCQKYWKRNVYKKFNRKNLENEEFTGYSIDLDKKDFIILEDLVRLLNMETGTFYRNRDLFTIFRRLCQKEDKISFSSFMNALCI